MNLSNKDLNGFKQQLLKLRQDLLHADETGQQAEQVVELDQTRIGRLSRMDALQAQAMSRATGHRMRKHLTKVDAALRRIDTDDYGDCVECDECINPKRLLADPTATLCIGCAEARE